MTATLTSQASAEHTDTPDPLHALQQARHDAARIAAEIEALRTRAGELTAEAAAEHDWCNYAEQAVTAAGCHWPATGRAFDVTVTLRVRCHVEPNSIREADDLDWVRSSLNLDDLADALRLDDDWQEDTLEVDLTSTTVGNLETL